MNDPMNQRPLDPAWEKRCDELAEHAAKELGSLVVMIAAQDGGKMGVCVGGANTPGRELDHYREMLKDMPTFFELMAELTRQAQAPKVQFAPGCFDDFPGTQEELQAFIAELHQLAASGELHKGARQLSSDEVEELRERIEQQAKRPKQ